MLGYALDCAIKACIAKQVKEYDFPDKNLANASYTHKLVDLLGVAGLKQKLQEMLNSNEDFKLNWAVAKEWSENSRYDFFDAVTNNKSGVLIWIKSWW